MSINNNKNVNTDVAVSHLHYADDTLLFGEVTMTNLWTIKTILRCFELALGLRVNFAKSCLMGIHVEYFFLRMAEGFLHCMLSSLPFKYLGLAVGANPRSARTWEPF